MQVDLCVYKATFGISQIMLVTPIYLCIGLTLTSYYSCAVGIKAGVRKNIGSCCPVLRPLMVCNISLLLLHWIRPPDPVEVEPLIVQACNAGF
jgi:hypothetical protein